MCDLLTAGVRYKKVSYQFLLGINQEKYRLFRIKEIYSDTGNDNSEKYFVFFYCRD